MSHRGIALFCIILLLMVGGVSATTWGNTGIGTSNDYWGQYTNTALLTAPSNISTLLSINYYSKDTSGTLDLKCGIWQTNGTLVANSVTNVISGVNTTAAWRYANFSAQPSLVSGNPYLVGCVASYAYNNYYYVTGPGTPYQFHYGTVDYTTPGNFAEYDNSNQIMSIYVEYTPTGGTDTTPPASITNLSNVTTCNSVNFTFNIPGDADFNHTMVWKNNIFQYNLSNVTTSDLWESLVENTAYTFSSKTVDITGNVNATFVNLTSTTDTCPVPTTSPTTTATTAPPTTTTASPTPTPTPTPLEGCTYFNLTGVTFGENSTDWNVTEGLNTWGITTFNVTQGNASWWICRATPITTAPLTWQPLINPSTDIKTDWLKLLWSWLWLPILILAMILLFRRQ